MKKKLIIIGSLITGLLVTAYFLIGNYFYNYALNVDREKEFLQDNPHLEESEAVVASVAKKAEQADDVFQKELQPYQLNTVTSDKYELTLNAYVYTQNTQM